MMYIRADIVATKNIKAPIFIIRLQIFLTKTIAWSKSFVKNIMEMNITKSPEYKTIFCSKNPLTILNLNFCDILNFRNFFQYYYHLYFIYI